MTLSHDLMLRVHRGEITPAAAFALQTARDAAGAVPGAPLPRLCVYTPWSATRDLGGEYNRIMARLEPDEWAIFLDHDANTLTNEFWPTMANAILAHPDAGAIVTYANRAGNPAQLAKAPVGDNMPDHVARAHAIRREYGNRTTDVTATRMTGVCFAVSKTAWLKAGPFASGMGEVDNRFATACVAAGLRIWRADGAYVWHAKRTSGKTPSNPVSASTTVDWRTAAATMRAHGSETLAALVAAHVDLVDSRTDWTDCQKRARRRTLLDSWRKTMRLSVVIPAREEDPAELAGTVATFRDAGAHEVIVVDDGSSAPVTAACGATLLLRNDAPAGVAASRNRGLEVATGNVIAFSDSHCRIVAGNDLLGWAFAAYCSTDFLTAASGGYGTPERFTYGCNLPWQGWYFNVDPNRLKLATTAPGPYGSVYCAAQWTWERIGGWVPTRGWGFNEQAMALACHHAGVPIRVTPEFRILHKYRSRRAHQPGAFPYKTNHHDLYANAIMVQQLLFTPATWETIMLPAVRRYMPDALDWFANRWTPEQFRALAERYAGLRRATDAVMLGKLGAERLLTATQRIDNVDGVE
jgi:hypothetical protein